MHLFWGSGSVPCFRPMIVLEEKGLSGYGHKQVEFSKQEHKGEDIMALNHRGQVPTFKHGDIVINESKGICQYLEDEFKSQGTQLIPSDAKQRAHVLQRMFEVDNLQDKGVIGVMYAQWKEKDLKPEILEERKKTLAAELSIWEGYLADKPFICGEQFTMADVFLLPILALFVRGSLSLEARPNLKKYYESLSERDSIKASWPPHYKTSPPTQIFAGV